VPAISSAVAGSDGLIVVTAPQHDPMYGLRVVNDRVEERWKLERPTPGTTSPLLYRDRVYAVDGRRADMVCLDAASGEVVWRERLDLRSTIVASPGAGDGKIYVLDSSGSVAAVAAGDRYEKLGTGRLSSSTSRSSVVIHHDPLLIRTGDRLYCIGKE